MTARIGIDLGGTKIEVLALEDGRERLRRRVATPAGDYEATLEAVAALVAEADAALGARATVGIATPGALSPATGLLRNSNSTCLNGKPLKQDLERRLGREIRIANDANCFALADAVDGAAVVRRYELWDEVPGAAEFLRELRRENEAKDALPQPDVARETLAEKSWSNRAVRPAWRDEVA